MLKLHVAYDDQGYYVSDSEGFAIDDASYSTRGNAEMWIEDYQAESALLESAERRESAMHAYACGERN